MPGLFPVTNTGGGQCMAFPNTCMTPGVAAGAPGPLPYPSIAMLADGSGSKKVKIKGKEVLRKGDKINKSDGDKPGNSPGGVVSGVFSGACEIMMGWAKVKAEGQQVGHQVSTVGQNGPGGKNIPVGIVSAVSITNVKVAVDMAAMMSDPTVIMIKCDDPPAPPPPTQEELDNAKASASAKAEGIPQKDPVEPRADRQRRIEEANDRILSGETTHPSGVGADRIRAATEGVNGQRVPLTFPTPELFAQFQAELGAVLRAGGVTDATVQAIGSATTGWKGQYKPFEPWKLTSDADYAVFSNQAIAQAEANNTVVNPKAPAYKNGAPDGKGFSDTPVGKKLSHLARRWTEILYGDPNVDGIDFKLNLSTKPFQQAITVVAP